MRAALTLALGGVLLAGAALADGDPAAGQKVAGMCRTCHGLDGFARIPIAPHIGGEPAAYLERQLQAFRDGSREHEMMSVVAAGLSDTQISDVAAWYAAHTAQVSAVADPDTAPDLCVACHGADGLVVMEDAPHLAGETNIYLETQLKAFRSGKRTHDIMSGIAAGMSDEEIRAVSNYYAGLDLTIAPPAQ